LLVMNVTASSRANEAGNALVFTVQRISFTRRISVSLNPVRELYSVQATGIVTAISQILQATSQMLTSHVKCLYSAK